jgi:pilus assembly protein Flp/PilA
MYLEGQEGQGLIEYSLIIVLIAIVVMIVLLILGPSISELFGNIVSSI